MKRRVVTERFKCYLKKKKKELKGIGMEFQEPGWSHGKKAEVSAHRVARKAHMCYGVRGCRGAGGLPVFIYYLFVCQWLFARIL